MNYGGALVEVVNDYIIMVAIGITLGWFLVVFGRGVADLMAVAMDRWL